MDNFNDRYIGDGVYASTDGWHIILDLRAQDTTTRIALEPEVFAQLVGYEKDARTHYENRRAKDAIAATEEETRANVKQGADG